VGDEVDLPVNQELHRLGQSTRRLNDGSEHLNTMIASIDDLLERLMIGLDYVHPRPLAEVTAFDPAGKRIVELSYLGYLRVHGGYHLAVKTTKIVESRLALATETPGQVMPLLEAPRRLRYAAVDVLPELIAGLAEQVEDMLGSMERRCQIARGLVEHLESIAGPVDPARAASEAEGATSHRRQTVPAFREP